ncbi:MAG: hypothetical protein DRP01_05620 [Archaeoglobales archaeon]|nr:MAG: hypothetical protein DRP01_05620 [Archaeoglobales archaeon]
MDGILKRYKGDRREVFYTFASESIRLKILKIFSALGFKFDYEPVLTEKFFDELKKAGAKLVHALGSILRNYGELLPIKLQVILQGLKKANDKVKDKVMKFVMEKLEEKGYVTFKEIMELDLIPVKKIRDVMEEIAESLDLVERRNGDQRRFITTYTKKEFAIVEYIKDGRIFRVPDRLRWELKPEVIGIS